MFAVIVLPVAALVSLLPLVLAQGIPLYGQCGGNGWTGSTVCATGAMCVVSNEWYSQCQPGTAPPVTTPSTAKPPTSTASPATGKSNYWFSFGDSYTQTGFNTKGVQPSSGNPLGNPPYPGNTAVGGANWVSYLALSYNKSSLLTYNYAVGGATTDSTLVAPWSATIPSLADQVDLFFNTIGSTPWKGENSLFSVYIGINDIGGSWFKPGDRAAFSDTLINRAFQLYERLYSAGARNFLFVNIPPMGRSPRELAGGSAQDQIIRTHNSKLAAKAAAFQASHPGSKTYIYDSFATFTRILNAPGTYGFKDATSFGQQGSFWGDNYHPGPNAHKLMAQDAAAAIKSTIF